MTREEKLRILTQAKTTKKEILLHFKDDFIEDIKNTMFQLEEDIKNTQEKIIILKQEKEKVINKTCREEQGNILKDLEKRNIIKTNEEIKKEEQTLQHARELLNTLKSEEIIDYIESIETIDTTKEKQINEIINYQPIRPTTGIILNDLLSNNFKNMENGEIHELGIGKNKNGSIDAMIKNQNIQTSKIMTPYDLLILESCITLFKDNKYIDAEMIYKLHTQNNRNRTGTNFIHEANESIEKMRTTLITIDIKEEVQNYFNISNLETFNINTYLLPLEMVEIKKGGTLKKMYRLLKDEKKGSYIDYTKGLEQMLSYKTELARVPRVEKESVLINREILKRVFNIKNGALRNKNILCDSIFKECELLQDIDKKSNTYRQYKSRYKKYIINSLDNLKTNKEIKGYKEIKKRNVFIGVEIELYNKK